MLGFTIFVEGPARALVAMHAITVKISPDLRAIICILLLSVSYVAQHLKAVFYSILFKEFALRNLAKLSRVIREKCVAIKAGFYLGQVDRVAIFMEHGLSVHFASPKHKYPINIYSAKKF